MHIVAQSQTKSCLGNLQKDEKAYIIGAGSGMTIGAGLAAAIIAPLVISTDTPPVLFCVIGGFSICGGGILGGALVSHHVVSNVQPQPQPHGNPLPPITYNHTYPQPSQQNNFRTILVAPMK